MQSGVWSKKINSINNYLKIFSYFAFVVSILIITKLPQRKRLLKTQKRLDISDYNNLNLFSIIWLSVLLGFISIIVSRIPYASDRYNYVVRFVNYWDSPWTIGLNFLADMIHLFSNDPRVLFFIVSFLSLFITLIAYNFFDNSNFLGLIFMSLSLYNVYSFYLLKQSLSIAFAAISIAALLKNRYFISISFLLFSISFHEAAYILIPSYFIFIGAKKKWIRGLEYLFMIISILLFGGLANTAFNIVNEWFPSLSDDVMGYFDSNNDIILSSNIFTWVKGLPYYIITGYAVIRRRILKARIKKYDSYLLMGVFASGFYLMSFHMYWMWRFGSYFYFPLFIFAGQIIKSTTDGNERIFLVSVLSISLGLISLRYLSQIIFLYGGF